MKQHKKILLVDDDEDLLKLLSIRLSAAGFESITATNAENALNCLDIVRPHLVISDMQMHGMDGMTLFEHIHRLIPTLPVIILTAYGTIPDAVAAVQRGIFGYLTKPYDPETLLKQVNEALRLTCSGSKSEISKDTQATWGKDIITQNAEMENLLTKVQRVAEGNASVLLMGESGVGKELFARAIHKASRRCCQPFVTINCAAIPEQLLESELFGHVKGAFSGAVRDHKGLFQLAEGGTLFLDEIGDMPMFLQAKLLHALQERVVRPVGSTDTIPVDVRIISATHRDPKAEILAGNFREDLYYRLYVVGLTIPALAQRREDIPLLANHFLHLFAEKYEKSINGFSPEAINLLISAAWPGNVRQLMNVVEQCIVLSANPLISYQLVYDAMHTEETELVSFQEACRQFERDYLVRLLKITSGNVTKAAKLAKRNRTEFYKLLSRHQLDFTLYKQQERDKGFCC